MVTFPTNSTSCDTELFTRLIEVSDFYLFFNKTTSNKLCLDFVYLSADWYAKANVLTVKAMPLVALAMLSDIAFEMRSSKLI